MSDGKSIEAELTPEQIANWRDTLLLTLGPYALIMPVDQIQRYRDEMQERLDLEAKKEDGARITMTKPTELTEDALAKI